MNYLYCERIPYFEHVMKIPQTTTRKELEGRKAHEIFSQRSKRLKLIASLKRLPRQYELHLEDQKILFRTAIDCLLTDSINNEAYILQVKNSAKHSVIYSGQRLQLVAEAYLVRKLLHYRVHKAYVKYLKSDDLIDLPVGEKTESEFLESLERIRSIIRSEIMPEPTPHKKRCPDCCFLKICRRI
jgi:CRISPR-associated exonuclease Cas4